ncbi:MAG: hypothetical protein FJW23_14750 [Acidimicrobiia bacterium]|nr:hypothetical protein [Acidimicrobiia bacterium]
MRTISRLSRTRAAGSGAAITRRPPFQGLPGVVGSVGSFCSTEAAHEVRRFFQDHPVPTAGGATFSEHSSLPAR